MNMQHPIAQPQPMTIEQFLEFYASRPDDEKWELIEGVPVMSATPVDWHQLVVANIIYALTAFKLETGAAWFAMPGVGTQVPISKNSLPEPDIFIKNQPLTGKPLTDNALVLFEVLSESIRRADRAWRRQVYASVPDCQHYVTVSLKRIEVMLHDRATAWEAQKLSAIDDAVKLSAIGFALPLATIYRWTKFSAD